MEDNRIARNPCDGVRLPKRQHADRGYLTHAQVSALADAVDRQPEVVRLLAYTGLRWGEMAALRVRDFDMLRRRVNVSRSVTESLGWCGVRRKPGSAARFRSRLHCRRAGRADGRQGPRQSGVHRHARWVLRNSNWRARRSSLRCVSPQSDEPFPSITPHDLRHMVASLAVSAGTNVKAVQRMLGHVKASMTLDVYADLFDADLDDVAVNLDAAIEPLPARPARTRPGEFAGDGAERSQTYADMEDSQIPSLRMGGALADTGWRRPLRHPSHPRAWGWRAV